MKCLWALDNMIYHSETEIIAVVLSMNKISYTVGQNILNLDEVIKRLSDGLT